MDASVRDRDEVDRVVVLADEHAHEFVECMHSATTIEELEAALAGAFILFLADALSVSEGGQLVPD